MKTTNKKAPTGAILLAKPEGITSFQALSLLKRNLGTKKVGHTGTLDKFASGLLVVLVGAFTRLNSYVTALDKEYEATFHFGETTATLDPEGEVTSTGRIPLLDEIEAVLPKFRGEILQRPPAFSAIHIDGKRAYERALDGEVVEIPARPITVYALDVLGFAKGDLRVRVHCSKGTYIRSLAHDIAEALGTVAYVTQLKRTKVGQFSLSDAVEAGDVSEDSLATPEGFFRDLGIPTKKVSDPAPFLGGKDLKFFLGEQKITCGEGKLALLDSRGTFVALICLEEGKLSYLFVAPKE